MRRTNRERGQAIGEFAIVIPLLFLMIVSLFDVGRLVYINNAIAEGAREGARWGAVQQRASTPSGLSAIEAEVIARMAAVPGPTVTVTCTQIVTTTTDCSTGDVINVHVSTSVQPVTPIIGDFIGALTFDATSNMTIHQ